MITLTKGYLNNTKACFERVQQATAAQKKEIFRIASSIQFWLNLKVDQYTDEIKILAEEVITLGTIKSN